MTGERVLEHPDLWQAFLKAIGGINMQQDVEAITSLGSVETAGAPCVNKMRTFCRRQSDNPLSALGVEPLPFVFLEINMSAVGVKRTWLLRRKCLF
jgi:hypothetical protein